MLTSHAAAEIVAERYPDLSFETTSLEDLGRDWLVPIGWIGVCAVLVDKTDGTISFFGSGLPLEIWRAAYELGFRHDLQRLTITGVRDLAASVEVLRALGVREPGVDYRPPRYPSAAELAERLRSLPAVFENQRLWTGYPRLVERGTAPLPFELSVERSDSRARVAMTRVVPDGGALRWLAGEPSRIRLVEQALTERRIEVVVTAGLSRLAMSFAGEGSVGWEQFESLPRRVVSTPSDREYGTMTVDDEFQDLVAAGWADLVVSDRSGVEGLPVVGTARLEQILCGNELSGVALSE